MYYHGWSDDPRGVHVKSLTPDGSDVTIYYKGLLNNKGASQVFLHTGFGDPMQWRTVEDYRMQRIEGGWKKTLNTEDKKFNFCFHDSANNWDNNNGYNWSYSIG
ncbi:MAG: Carbohydrate binding domain (family 25) [Pelotomaculum sp. PtaU1.Bin035]|nr:MAG: Carbohydrate binding domain (family 25) [Pelotomaculum sp. PtaU1.Bin035]